MTKACGVNTLTLILLFAVGCGPSVRGDLRGAQSAAISASASAKTTVAVRFDADGSAPSHAPLVRGDKLSVSYDKGRLNACRGGTNDGGPAWVITGFYRMNGGAVSSFFVAGLNSAHEAPAEIALSAAGDLELWFQNTSLWGCSAYDSNEGANYHLTVLPSANAPGWMGNALYVISRETCDALACGADYHALDGGFTYDTWTRQRAAIRRAYFDVWKAGVTDFDNADLWKQLDVQVHYRVVGAAAFSTAFATFDSRLDHNARFAVELQALDPLAQVNVITDKGDCPTFPVTYSGPSGAQYIDADLELYFTVNGTELRASDGDNFHATYENYAGLYAICR